MIKVCDAIMGTGKSQSAIAYMNEHSDEKFIYITPYLDEAERIRQGCPALNFVEPSDKIAKYHFKKGEHTAALIRRGRNIASTHQAFRGYTPEMLDNVRSQGYTLIIDENVDVLEEFEFNSSDLQIAIDAGYISEKDGVYSATDKEYAGGLYSELFNILRTRELIQIDEGENLFYWVLPPALITSFKDVFILTYLFEGQSLHHFLEIYNIPYEYIGISKGDSGYSFSDFPGYVPEYVSRLGDMIHIIDSPKLNDVGSKYHALSMNWFDQNKDGVSQLKKNIHNLIVNIWSDIPANQKLWATYKKEFSRIKGYGYATSFLNFNAKATNVYRDRMYLIYVVNVFMNVNDKKFYQKHGIEVDEDMFALSIMVQWIWRSAIRDGEEVYLYIPSSRMRNILINWINTVSKGGNAVG